MGVGEVVWVGEVGVGEVVWVGVEGVGEVGLETRIHVGLKVGVEVGGTY